MVAGVRSRRAAEPAAWHELCNEGSRHRQQPPNVDPMLTPVRPKGLAPRRPLHREELHVAPVARDPTRI